MSVAVVTGAGRGLGAAVARELASRGMTVVAADIDLPAAERLAQEIEGDAVHCDVRREDQVAALMAHAAERHGGLDVAVANAGVAGVEPLVEMSYEEFRRVMAVNLDGVFLTMKHAAAQMAPRGGGSIVAMASITALAGSPLIGHYAAAKAGVVSLAKTMAIELRDAGVRVNAVCPGFVDTDMVRDHKGELEAGLGGIDMDEVIAAKQGRYGTPEEVAKLVAFVASPRAGFSTASAFVIDGGARASLL